MINVLQNHANNPEFCKKSCVILLQMLKECDDPQLAYRMVECGCAEALQLIIETEPEKDDETKQLVLEILNELFTVKGVMHKNVAKHGKGVLKMFMNTDQPKLAKSVIDCLHNTANEGLEELDNESLAKMNSLVNAHKTDIGVNQSGSLYIRNLFDNSSQERIQNCGITVRDIVKSFGPYNMDEKVFRNLDVAIDKLGSDQDFYQVLDVIQNNPNSDDFWIMSHLVDLPSIDMQSKKAQLDSILKKADQNNLVGSLNAEVCFFMKELHRSHPDISRELMKDKSSLIKKVMDEIDNISGPHKFLGLQVLEQNIGDHGKFMRDNDIIKKAEKWIKECQDPKDMCRILNFLQAFCDDKDFKQDMLRAGLDTLAINKCKAHFAEEPETFDSLTQFTDRCVTEANDVVQFCDNGNMKTMIDMASTLVDGMQNFDRFIDFTVKMFDVPKVSEKLYESYNELTRLFCTRFEKRIIEFFDKWFQQRNKKEVWSQQYRPEFLECVAIPKERQALKKLMVKTDPEKLEGVLHKFSLGEKGMDALTELSQLVSTLVCFIAQGEPDDMLTIPCRVPIDDCIQSLKNNLEFITEKAIKNRVVLRYLALFCILLPHFKQKGYVKKIAARRSEFPCHELINFVELATTKQPLVPFYIISAYGLYFIPEDLRPEIPRGVAQEGDDDLEKDHGPVESPIWTPLTFILNDEKISSPVSDFLVKITKKKGPQQQIINFMGYLSLVFSYQFGTVDTDLLLASTLLSSLVNQVDDESLDFGLATSAIYCVDSWCENSERAIIKLNSMGCYDKLLRFMNNLRNQDVLRLVISSLLQKLANFNDGHQLEIDLERLVKKCKDYDEIVATKGDEKREDVLQAYNDLSGLLQIQKAQQFCINKQLQTTILSTLAQELKRNPDELMSKGLIVNYQDNLGKMLACGNLLAPNSKTKPEDIANLSLILRKGLNHWKNDPLILGNILELTKNNLKRPGQLDYSPEVSLKVYEELEALTHTYKNSPEILSSIRDVQALLELPKQNEEKVEENVEEPGAQIEPIVEVPAEPEPEVEPEPVFVAEPEPVEEEVYDVPAEEELIKEEQEQEEIKNNFVTEEIFQDTQKDEAVAQKVIDDNKPKEEEVIVAIEEPEPVEQPLENQSEPLPEPSDEWDLRIEKDRIRAFALLVAKSENPDDASQDGLIYKVVLLAEELVCDEYVLAEFYARWIAKLTSIQIIAHYTENPTVKLKDNLEKYQTDQKILKHTCSALANLTSNNQYQIPVVIASDILPLTRNLAILSTEVAVFGFFAKMISNITQTDENKVVVSQKGVIKVFSTYLKLKDSNEGVLKAVFKAVNSLCGTKQSCPVNVEKTDFIEVLVDYAAHVIPSVSPVCLVLETFGIIFKFGGEKVRQKAVEAGATEFYTE